jgi:hypothetical protein
MPLSTTSRDRLFWRTWRKWKRLLQQGATSVELPFDAWGENPEESATTRISLEADWSAADNATRCFNRYRRAYKLASAAPTRREELETEARQIATWEAEARAAQNYED